VRRLLRWIIGLALIAGLTAGAYAKFGWGSSKLPNFRQMQVAKGDLISVVNSTGTVQPVLSVQVGTFVSGPIESIEVDFNSRVKQGDTLAKIDTRTFKANVSRDEASRSHRIADKDRVAALLEQAKNNEKRAKALREKKATYISDAEIDQVTAERASLEAQLKLAEAAVQEADAALSLSRANLEYCVIKSPVDGIIVDRKVDRGQTVAAAFQTPVMFVIAPEMEQRMFVYASVDEADIGMIRRAKEENQPATFTVDAYPDDLFTGTISQVRLNPTTVQNVVTYTVVVEAPNRELKLLPGMTATLSFQIEKHPEVVKVPNSALRYFPKPEEVNLKDRELLDGVALAREESKETGTIRRSATAKAEAAKNRNRRHVWRVDGDLLSAVEIVTGISDSEYTELVSGDVKIGEQLVTGVRPKEYGTQ
jgi:HlyD family secretion protein